MRSCLIAVFLSGWVMAAATNAGQTIFVDASVAASGDGSSWEEAFKTIGEGVAELTEVNAASPGGHTIKVAAGTYSEVVTLTSAGHSGVEGNMNALVGVGRPEIVGAATVIRASADYFRIDGFQLYGTGNARALHFPSSFNNGIIENCVFIGTVATHYGSLGAISSYRCADNLIVRNCVFLNMNDSLYWNQNADRSATFENCTFISNTGVNVFNLLSQGRVTVRNSIFAGVNGYVFRRGGSAGKMFGENNLFYGVSERGGIIHDAPNGIVYSCVDEVNALEGEPLDFSGNIVANPGFSDLANNWNVGAFYEGSPVLTASTEGGVIGAVLNPNTEPVSDKTYYVDGSIGDDGRTKEQATDQNTPWATIGKAAMEAVAGDTVIVKAGTYEESVTIARGGSEDLGVSYIAEGDVVVEGAAHGFLLDRIMGVTLDGFEVTGSDTGLSLENAVGCILRRMSIHGNASDGIYTIFSMANLIEDSSVFDNATGINAPAYRASNLTVSRCLIRGNETGIFISLFSLGWLIENSAIYDNSERGISLYPYRSSPASAIVNCVFFGNAESGVFLHQSLQAIDNNVFSGNGSGVFEATRWDGSGTVSDWLLRHNCFHENENNLSVMVETAGVWERTALNEEGDINAVEGCENNIVADPMFWDAAARNFRIPRESPLVDAGTPTTDLATDFYGNPRLSGEAVDIGLHEVQPPAPTLIMVR